MKKLLSVFVAVSVMLSVFAGTAQAEMPGERVVKIERKCPTGGFVPLKAISERTVEAAGPMLFSDASAGYDYWEVYNSIELQLRNHEPEVLLYSNGYFVPPDEATNIYRRVLYDNYDIFVLDLGEQPCDSYRNIITIGSDVRYLYSFVPGYYYTELEEAETGAKALMDRKINEYLELVSDIPSDDVVGKLLVLHDAVCADIEYADDELDEDPYNNHLRTVYDALKTGRTVCQGYALVFKAVCDALNERLKSERAGTGTGATGSGGTDGPTATGGGSTVAGSGGTDGTAHASGGGTAAGGGTACDPAYSGTEDIIETITCGSDYLEHMWDVVKIGGQWYHIDPTWADMDGDVDYDDPLICACYDYFMKSDYEFTYPTAEDASTHSEAVPGETEGEFDYRTDWVLFTDEHVTCDDNRYSQGYIFNRVPYGMMSYSDGMYNIDFWGWCFRSEGIIATKVLVTDSFEDEIARDGKKIPYTGVLCFPEYSGDFVFDTVPYRRILVSYSDGILTDVSIGEEKNLSFEILAVWDGNPYKMFLWSPDLREPLCRAVDIVGRGSTVR